MNPDDPMTPDHPLFEDLSAHHDGEAPEWAGHVAGCASCRGRLTELTELSATVGGDGPRTEPATRDGLAPGDAGGDPVSRAVSAARSDDAVVSSPGGPRRWMLAASVAAVLLVSAGMGALVARRADHPPAPTAAGSGATEGADGTVSGSEEAVIVGGDLGEIPDRGALVTRVRADIDARSPDQARGGAPLSPGAAPGPGESADNETGSPPAQAPALAGPERGDGPYPCEAEALSAPGERGRVIYRATAEKAGTPAVVLAFGPPPGSEPVTVEVRARSDCRLLIEGAIL